MIEGLRVAPAYLDARNGPSKPFAPNGKNCEECRRNVTAAIRQDLGCVYEPRIERPGSVWAPQSWIDRGVATTVCPGYTTSLPAVVEVIDAHAQWKAGYLTEALDGEAPSSVALECLTALEGGINEHQADTIRRKSKAGA